MAGTALLVDAGAFFDHPYSIGWTALHMAASFGHEALVSLLIEAGASVNRRASDGCTPLHAACIQGHVGCAQVLLVHGADPQAELIDMTSSTLAQGN